MAKINLEDITLSEIQTLEQEMGEYGFDFSPTFTLTADQLELYSPSSATVTKGNLWPIMDYFKLLQRVSVFSDSKSSPVVQDFDTQTSDFMRLNDSAKRAETLFYFLSTLHARNNLPWVEWNILPHDESISHKTTSLSYQYPALLPHPMLNATVTADILFFGRYGSTFGFNHLILLL